MTTVKTATLIKDRKGEDTKMTVGDFLSEVLWNSRENQSLSYVLAKKFSVEEEVDLKAEEVVHIKKVIQSVGARSGEAGQVLEVIEPPKKEEKKK